VRTVTPCNTCIRATECHGLPHEPTARGHWVHSRYKDLAMVEKSFRMSKTGHLELRPIHVRTEKSTRGHVFAIMLTYLPSNLKINMLPRQEMRFPGFDPESS